MSENGLQALRQEHDDFFRAYWLNNMGMLPTEYQLAGLWCDNMSHFYYLTFEEFRDKWLAKWEVDTRDFLPKYFILN